ncbi:MAG: hypothetical protein FJ313_02375, partial [Gemmatimonadetes bacterium]|nr:hypothetical protein [Gemmatimonadota bacterium]
YERLVPVDLRVGEEAEALEPAGQSPLPSPMRLGVYRIAELALGNVVKHASASECTVRCDYAAEPGELRLVIEDDGAGFDVAADEGAGLGLAMMRDYADSLGGRLAIASSPGKGTRVEAVIPFKSDRWPAGAGTGAAGPEAPSGPG